MIIFNLYTNYRHNSFSEILRFFKFNDELLLNVFEPGQSLHEDRSWKAKVKFLYGITDR